MTVTFLIIKKTVGLRVSIEEEIMGLDITEHGLVSSYADFMPALTDNLGSSASAPVVSAATAISPDDAVPVVNAATPGVKITKVSIVTRPSKFEPLKAALDGIGITGVTVTNVMGYGMQKGHTEYYRGVPVETHLVPKIKVEIVICKVPVGLLIDTVKQVLYTGNVGDGKIFIYDIENVIKVRTGEEGFDALQDEE